MRHGAGERRRGGAALTLATALAGLMLVLAPACGNNVSVSASGGGGHSGSSGIGSTTGSDAGMTGPWPNLPAELSVQGGSALAPSGQGQNGGTLHLISQGDTSFDPTMAPAPTTIPAAPGGAMTIASSALGSDVSVTGDAVIGSDVTTSGSDAVRKISVSGDLYVTATLRAGDLGSGRQGLDLEVGGTIYK